VVERENRDRRGESPDGSCHTGRQDEAEQLGACEESLTRGVRLQPDWKESA